MGHVRELWEPFRHPFSISVYEGVVEYSFKRFAERKEHQKLAEKGDGPLVFSKLSHHPACMHFLMKVERKCEKCGNEQMTYTAQQTRSADEGQTVFFTCPKCK